jgi:RNA polymerase sigma-70 factor (ECF subfamily)
VICIPALLVAIYLLLPLFVKQRSHTHDGGIPMARVIEAEQAIPRKQDAATSSNSAPTVAEMPPVVVSTQPISGTRDVKPGRADIRVRFSKAMTDRSWSWTTAWPDSMPKLIGEPRFESDRRTCVLGVELEPERTYAFWLNSEKFQNFKDPSGRAAVPYLLIFRTVQN